MRTAAENRLVFYKHGEQIVLLNENETYHNTPSFLNYLLEDVNELYNGNDGLYTWMDDAEPYEVQPFTLYELDDMVLEFLIQQYYNPTDFGKNTEPVGYWTRIRNEVKTKTQYLMNGIKSIAKWEKIEL